MKARNISLIAVFSVLTVSLWEARAKDRGGEFEKQMDEVRGQAERLRRADAAAVTAGKLLEMIPDQGAGAQILNMRGISRVGLKEAVYGRKQMERSAVNARGLLSEIRKSDFPKGSGNLMGAVYSAGKKALAGDKGDLSAGEPNDYLSKEKVDLLFSAAVQMVSLAEMRAQGVEVESYQAAMAAKTARELMKMSAEQYSRYVSHQMRDMFRYEMVEDSYDGQAVLFVVGSASRILTDMGKKGFPKGTGEKLRQVYPMGSLERIEKGFDLPHGKGFKDYLSKERVDILFLAAVQLADLLEKR